MVFQRPRQPLSVIKGCFEWFLHQWTTSNTSTISFWCDIPTALSSGVLLIDVIEVWSDQEKHVLFFLLQDWKSRRALRTLLRLPLAYDTFVARLILLSRGITDSWHSCPCTVSTQFAPNLALSTVLISTSVIYTPNDVSGFATHNVRTFGRHAFGIIDPTVDLVRLLRRWEWRSEL